MKILQRTEISMVRAMLAVQLKHRKRSTNVMSMLGLSEIRNQLLDMAKSVLCYGHVSRIEDGHVLRALDLEVECQRKRGRLKRTWKKKVEDESVKIWLRKKDVLCQSKWSVGINQIADGLR